jgi:hypothetical protein
MNRINVENGKYTFVKHDQFIEILRHGEQWHKQSFAYAALVGIMAELDAARVVLRAARELGDDTPSEIKNALDQHGKLIGDRELPSKWTET